MPELEKPRKQDNNNNNQIDKCDNKWNIERLILVFTFLCTVVGTYYSIHLSNLTIQQLSAEVRPWITISELKNVTCRVPKNLLALT
jgi:hypothetical protein